MDTPNDNTGRAPVDPAAHLLAYVHGRDVACPICGYNLRDLTRAICPECEQPLRLTVGVRDPRFGWFVAAVAPSIFSGIAALFLMIPIIMMGVTVGTSAPWPIMVIEGFGLTSGLTGIALFRRRVQFLRRPPGWQTTFALASWGIHIGATVIIFLVGFLL